MICILGTYLLIKSLNDTTMQLTNYMIVFGKRILTKHSESLRI